jgi:hypothetical protein
VPTPLPDPDAARLVPPDAVETGLVSGGVVTAVAPPGGLTAVQRLLIAAIFEAMTGHPATLDGPPIGPEKFAADLAGRNLAFRTRIVQIMILVGLVLRPLPPEVAERITAFAFELSVDDEMLAVARRFADGSLGLAAMDFERNGYASSWTADDAAALHTSRQLASVWDATVADAELGERWEQLERLPEGTLGRRVTEFYRARGFAYPGRTGSAPPLLAQHDWMHVLADYGTSVESELEVFALIARANDDMHAFSLLAMVVSLFETGYLRSGAGLFEYSPGHLSAAGMPVRVADAMRRGALCPGSTDFLRIDWFQYAELSLASARAHFGLPPKSEGAIVAGSVGPFELGGISSFQIRSGAEYAATQRRPYDSYGAQVSDETANRVDH